MPTVCFRFQIIDVRKNHPRKSVFKDLRGLYILIFITLIVLSIALSKQDTEVLLNENKDRAIFCGGMFMQLLAVIYLIKALIIVA